MERENYKVTQMDSQERFRNLCFQPGDIIAGRYEFIRTLGRGAMGIVMLCKDKTADDCLMALKTTPDALRSDSKAAMDLKREYITMLALTHPGIVAVRNLAEDNFRFYVVMDYAEGETLEAYLKKHPKPGLAITKEVIRHLAAALDYAHKMGLVHRDVKPANVMVQIDGDTVKSVKLLDFGLGRYIRESFLRTTGNDLTSGTPAYKSPEQWSPKLYGKPTAKSDQYALGAVAYEMLNGAFPFADRDLETLGYAVLNENPENITDTSKTVNAALMKVLAKRSENRFDTCMAFATALAEQPQRSRQNIVYPRPISQPPVTQPSVVYPRPISQPPITQQPAGYQPMQPPTGYQPMQQPAGYQPMQQPAGYQPIQQPAAGYQPVAQQPPSAAPFNSGIVWAILTTIFCCWPIPVPLASLTLSIISQNEFKKGDIINAQKHASLSKKLSIIGAVIGGIAIICYLFLVLIGVVSELE